MKINITCGQIANNILKNKYDEIFIPFNEAMIHGNPKEKIFSEEFILERVKAHQTTLNEYLTTMHEFLEIKDEFNHYEIICWFGNECFCQINLLTLFAYLDQHHYSKNIQLNMINEETYLIEKTYILNPKNYANYYQKVILEHQFISTNFTYMDEAILEYLKNKS